MQADLAYDIYIAIGTQEHKRRSIAEIQLSESHITPDKAIDFS